MFPLCTAGKEGKQGSVMSARNRGSVDAPLSNEGHPKTYGVVVTRNVVTLYYGKPCISRTYVVQVGLIM